MILPILIGSGIQVACVVLLSLFLGVIGFFSPVNYGYIPMAIIAMLTVTSVFSGYFSTRNYMLFNRGDLKKNALLTAICPQGVIFLIFIMSDLCLRSVGSSAAISAGSMFTLIGLWLENYFGITAIRSPQLINDNTIYTIGIIMLLGLLFNAGLYTACVIVKFLFRFENYDWWWRSFETMGFCGVHLFFFRLVYFCLWGDRSASGLFIYSCYSLIYSLCLSVMTGSVSYYFSLLVTRRIYNNIHIN
ncbi:hypothetical protein SAMD00019534_015650 [Acytostelium subglobosum LB1]|uniref:hypothetical protein n=1 Tax=Acytostelium subglobosum LB1 TaxID=1410327 RepID=UPI000644846E|nr:hypothetical protein SAMD00019534_015650 [Acytostelium subglobosum LB1]GAM18390.1 hypothetical protein SAMD00019534_015650 [Acytostelium subglobosum LB1]|eukprot:XP_012757610.1 hypothetical protein SAMD00019534_015650 [Acytostelium subglobosum LB1]